MGSNLQSHRTSSRIKRIGAPVGSKRSNLQSEWRACQILIPPPHSFQYQFCTSCLLLPSNSKLIFHSHDCWGECIRVSAAVTASCFLHSLRSLRSNSSVGGTRLADLYSRRGRNQPRRTTSSSTDASQCCPVEKWGRTLTRGESGTREILNRKSWGLMRGNGGKEKKYKQRSFVPPLLPQTVFFFLSLRCQSMFTVHIRSMNVPVY